MPWLIKLVEEPENPTTNPPPNWENLLIPPGQQPVFYDYQNFVPKFMFDGTYKTTLLWARVYLWLPAQRFCLMSLQKDNTWKMTGVVDGPSHYWALNIWDGENQLLRLIAAPRPVAEANLTV